MANIKLNNNLYPIPDSVLASHTADFVAHLGTIAGSGMKVVIGGVEYGVDASKVSGALDELETALDELVNSGSNEIPNPELCNESNSGTEPVNSWSGSVFGKNKSGSYKKGDAVRIYANNVLVYNRVYTGVNNEYMTQYYSDDLLVVT